jgi:hypothetical protein
LLLLLYPGVGIIWLVILGMPIDDMFPPELMEKLAGDCWYPLDRFPANIDCVTWSQSK